MSGDIKTIDGPRVLPASGGDPKSLVILCHGYGSNGYDLIGLVPLWREALPDTAFVSPNAPEPCPGAPGGHQWWDLSSRNLQERESGVRRAAPVLDRFIDAELNRYSLAEDRLALVGFSQGTMLALHVATQRDRPVAGVVAYSGMIADEGAIRSARSKPPVLLTHGDRDPVLPIAAFHEAKALLESSGFELTTHISRGMAHSIDNECLRLGREFLKRVLI